MIKSVILTVNQNGFYPVTMQDKVLALVTMKAPSEA